MYEKKLVIYLWKLDTPPPRNANNDRACTFVMLMFVLMCIVRVYPPCQLHYNWRFFSNTFVRLYSIISVKSAEHVYMDKLFTCSYKLLSFLSRVRISVRKYTQHPCQMKNNNILCDCDELYIYIYIYMFLHASRISLTPARVRH